MHDSLVPVRLQEGLVDILGWTGHTGTPPPPLHTVPDFLHCGPDEVEALGPCCTCSKLPYITTSIAVTACNASSFMNKTLL